MNEYVAVIQDAGANYSAYVPDLPGCTATGATIEETEREIREAIEFHIEGLRLSGFPVPRPPPAPSPSPPPASRGRGRSRRPPWRLLAPPNAPRRAPSYTRRTVKVRDVIRLLEADGWYHDRTRGSHRQFKHPTKVERVTVSGHPGVDVPIGTLKNIFKQAGLRER